MWLLSLVLALLLMAYSYGLTTQWDQMTQRPVRASYFFSDMLVLFPLGIASLVGLVRRKRWSGHIYLLTLGVLLFDMAHQMFYLFFDNYFGVPLYVPIMVMAIVIVYSIYGSRVIFKHSFYARQD